MTLEELQKQALDNADKITALQTENEKLKKERAELSDRNEKLVAHNSDLFNRLSQQNAQKPEPEKIADAKGVDEILKDFKI